MAPSLPAQAVRQDNMYNVPKDITMMQLNFAVWKRAQYGDNMEK